MSEGSTLSLEKLTKVYLKMTAKRTELKSAFDKRLNQKNVRQYLEENPDKLPKGLNSDSSYTLSVRRPKK